MLTSISTNGVVFVFVVVVVSGDVAFDLVLGVAFVFFVFFAAKQWQFHPNDRNFCLHSVSTAAAEDGVVVVVVFQLNYEFTGNLPFEI